MMHVEEMQVDIKRLKEIVEMKDDMLKKASTISSFSLWKRPSVSCDSLPFKQKSFDTELVSQLSGNSAVEDQVLQTARGIVEDSNFFVLQLKKDMDFLAEEVQRLQQENWQLSRKLLHHNCADSLHPLSTPKSGGIPDAIPSCQALDPSSPHPLT